ncbi:adenylate/guanylate cyclase domain-containing protein [Algihabitans albus]|uniref:adenylate/guanylate cyclase domain-containing protein n=1 Tax=Algihabitans albus TaxID=2164067 RepID=UPI0013C36576|nr:adenylate/guanylate cyclase domain-containing protein [Algihabitans albus]
MTTRTTGSAEKEAGDAMARARAVRDWLLNEARFLDDPDEATEGFAQRLIAAGLPLDRMASAMPTLYAVRRGLGRIWSRKATIKALDFPWDNQAIYEASPYYQAHLTRRWVTFRLDEIRDEAYNIVPELRAEGYRHYICMPIFFSDGAEGGITFATCNPDGFSDEDIAILQAIEPEIAIVLDLNRARRLLQETLRMYVGDEPHTRILSGQVRRGEVLHIRSAILFTDMRGFTALSAAMSAEDTVALLNRYFDCVVPPIERRGGQVLKYIGDGVLAIHRAGETEQAACMAALESAKDIIARVAEDCAGARDGQRFGIKIGLHYGEVAYGNIGSGARLDYTVVGSDVNIASRLADLAGRLDRQLLVSSSFVEMLPNRPFQSLGQHALRGVASPQSVLEPAG